MKWILDNITTKGVIFSSLCKRGDSTWVEIYDWCNEHFGGDEWEFWYEQSEIELESIIVNFEFFQHEDIVHFKLRWG